MKKLLIIPALLLLITGCGTKSAQQERLDKINEGYQNEQTELNSAAFKKMSEENKDQQQQPVAAAPQAQVEDLAKEYKGAVLKTNMGDIQVEFYASESPMTVNNFLTLAKKGFYDGTRFHRVIKDFMIQGGDPNSKSDDWGTHGRGGPGYQFQDEFNQHPLVSGSLAMANSGPNTNGSQFFIVTATSTPWLDGRHTNFGQVTSGMDIVSRIEGVKVNENDHPLDDVIINGIELVK